MSEPKKLLKKIIIAVYCEDRDWSNNAKIGVFMNSLMEKPVIEFHQYGLNNFLYEKGIVEKMKKLMTDDYRWEVIFSQEIKVLKLDQKIIYFIDPKPYANFSNIQYQF